MYKRLSQISSSGVEDRGEDWLVEEKISMIVLVLHAWDLRDAILTENSKTLMLKALEGRC